VVSVEIVPPVVHAEPHSTFALRAVARDASGNVIPDPPRAKWSGSVQFADRRANPVEVTASDVNIHDVRVKMGGQTSPPATILVNQGGAGAVYDQVQVEQMGQRAPATVLLHAKAQGGQPCARANDRVYALSGRAVLDENLRAGCPNEAAIFGEDRAPLVEVAPDLPNTQWTDAADLLSRPTLPGMVTVPLSVWYYVAESEPEQRGAHDLEEANAIYAANLAGITFSIRQTHLMGVDALYGGDAYCTNIRGSLSAFDPDPGRLNVVYVRAIDWNSDPFGWTCPKTTGVDDVVLIAWSRPNVTALAHELAHTLGFASPPFEWSSSGHVNGFAGFDASNLMWITGLVSVNDEQSQLTLGQVYRMHVDRRSWINRADLRSHGKRADCPCDPEDDTQCPKLIFNAR
jgi:hypothetical protein